MRELLVLRHAKSARDTAAPTDFDRPLARRGRKDCRRIADWMAARELLPDHIVASPAARARDTARRVARRLGADPADTAFDEDLYLAGFRTILRALRAVPPPARRVLLVGHNPGLDDLVLHLASRGPERAASGKLMTTAALAWLRLPDDWDDLPSGCGELVALARPREIRA